MKLQENELQTSEYVERKFVAIRFSEDHSKEWDDFILNKACNGTFLQSRQFLNYHPENKYTDYSLMFYEKEKLVAVCPACIIYEGTKKIFYSHAGSTYGGIIVVLDVMRAEKMLALLESFEENLKINGFEKCILKQTNSLMCTCPMDLLEYCFYYNNYHEYKELDVYIDFRNYDKDNVIGNFSKLKKRLTKKCIKEGMEICELKERDDLNRFREILVLNLKKYNLKPYHSLEDLIDLKRRFPNEIQFWGCEYEGEIIAVSMVFLFCRASCVHTHYLAADPRYNKLSPMTFIYYKMIDLYKEQGYQTLSWGITTEHLGVELNKNLTNTKEEFGGRHNIVKIYEKNYR